MCRHWLLPSLFLLISHALLASSSSPLVSPPPSDCVDLICPSTEPGNTVGLLEREGHQAELLDGDNGGSGVLEKCRECQDCTHSGYSFCVQPRHFDPQRRHLVSEEGACECAHSGPSILGQQHNIHYNHDNDGMEAAEERALKCRLVPGTARGQQLKSEPKVESGEGLFRLCYANALRKLPTPIANNTAEDVLVTVDQFWLSDYWRALRPRHLRLFYVFPIARKEHCEGHFLVPSAQDMMWINAGKTRDQVTHSDMTWLCKASLKIVMNGLEEEEQEEEEEEYGEAKGEKEDNDDDDDVDIDPDLPPEVQFERDVFAGADKVRFYFELKVRRENQLKAGAAKLKLESRDTLTKSDNLDFDLHPEKYGKGAPRSSVMDAGEGMRSGNGTTALHIDRMKIEEHQRPPPGDKLDLATTRGHPREPIVRPAYGRTGKVKSAEGSGTRTTPSSPATSSSIGPRPIHSRPISESVHNVDQQSTAMPVPGHRQSEMGGGGGRHEDDGDEDDEDEATSPHSPSDADGDDAPTEEEWQLLRNILIISLILLALFVAVALCYKCGFCCKRNHGAAAGQQRNGSGGKTRVQNGKEYRQTGTK